MKEKPKAIIIDLEGTLSDHSHRVIHYNFKDYDKYNSGFKDDPVNYDFVRLLENEQTDEDLIIIMVTAKSEIYKNDVDFWLRDNGITFISEIHYRDPGDKSPSVEVKRLYLEALKERFAIVHAYDDREDICEMYRNNGMPCTQVKIDSKPKASLTVAQYLRQSADVFEERDACYGSSYKHFGNIVEAFFPGGLNLESKEDMNRYGILNMIFSKLNRYCNNFNKGGHRDSLVDLSTYSAMLNEVDNEL